MRLGDKYTWTPAAWMGEKSAEREARGGKTMQIPRSVTGRVVYIHPLGRYFTARAETPGGPITESFQMPPGAEGSKT